MIRRPPRSTLFPYTSSSDLRHCLQGKFPMPGWLRNDRHSNMRYERMASLPSRSICPGCSDHVQIRSKKLSVGLGFPQTSGGGWWWWRDQTSERWIGGKNHFHLENMGEKVLQLLQSKTKLLQWFLSQRFQQPSRCKQIHTVRSLCQRVKVQLLRQNVRQSSRITVHWTCFLGVEFAI